MKYAVLKNTPTEVATPNPQLRFWTETLGLDLSTVAEFRFWGDEVGCLVCLTKFNDGGVRKSTFDAPNGWERFQNDLIESLREKAPL